MLDEDCYNDDAEHTFTNFSHDGKTEYITRNLIKNLSSFHITYNIAAYAQSQSEDRYERYVFRYRLDDVFMKHHFIIAN